MFTSTVYDDMQAGQRIHSYRQWRWEESKRRSATPWLAITSLDVGDQSQIAPAMYSPLKLTRIFLLIITGQGGKASRISWLAPRRIWAVEIQ